MAGQEISQAKGNAVRRLLVPLLVLVVLLAVYLFVQKKERQSVAPDKIENFLELKAGNVNNFRIERIGSKVFFEMINGIWHVLQDSIPRKADSAAVANLLNTASAMEVGTIESSNPQKQMVYEVDTLMGTKLSFFNDDTRLASVIIGKNAQGYGYSYVRKPESDDVYRAKGVMGYQFNKPVTAWMDKTILKADTSMLQNIAYTYSDESFVLTRQDSLWYLSGSGIKDSIVADSDSIELLKRLIVNLQSDDFYQPMDSAYYLPDSPETAVTFSFSNGQTEELHFHGTSENGNRHYLRKNDSDMIFVLFSHKHDRLVSRSNKFIP